MVLPCYWKVYPARTGRYILACCHLAVSAQPPFSIFCPLFSAFCFLLSLILASSMTFYGYACTPAHQLIPTLLSSSPLLSSHHFSNCPTPRIGLRFLLAPFTEHLSCSRATPPLWMKPFLNMIRDVPETAPGNNEAAVVFSCYLGGESRK